MQNFGSNALIFLALDKIDIKFYASSIDISEGKKIYLTH